MDEEKIRNVLVPKNYLSLESLPYEQLNLFSALPTNLPKEERSSIILPFNESASSYNHLSSSNLSRSSFVSQPLSPSSILLEDTSTALTGEL